jgi:hypothetical protein
MPSRTLDADRPRSRGIGRAGERARLAAAYGSAARVEGAEEAAGSSGGFLPAEIEAAPEAAS